MKHAFSTQVFYSDTDAYGVVWHGSYLRWLEMGRVMLCEKAGYKIIFPVEETVSAISPMQLEDFVCKFNNERLVCSNGKPTLQNLDSITVCA